MSVNVLGPVRFCPHCGGLTEERVVSGRPRPHCPICRRTFFADPKLAVAVLVANNLRDLATDSAAGRRTLVVRLGDGRARALYAGLVLGGAAIVPGAGVALRQLPLEALLVLCAVPALVAALRLAGDRRRSRGDLVPLLLDTTRLHLAAGTMLVLGFLTGMSSEGIPAWLGVVIGLVLAAGLAAADLLPA